jgi:D-3-phosphoglycerate dehydrogenase
MPLEGDSNFDGLKKAYANGIELRGKTLGIVGIGRIGQAAKMALGLGMKVIADSFIPQVDIKVTFFDGQSITTTIVSQPLNSLFKEADFITLHVPAQDGYIMVIRTSNHERWCRYCKLCSWWCIDEVALVKNNGKYYSQA